MNEIIFGLRIKGDASEGRAALRNLESAARPASQQLQQTAISAKQLSAAMRGLPAQFTDIATSIAGGQAPLTVLLQQGGQLKDMFGGVGPAAKALGGYVAGLVSPFSVAAAAAAVLGAAWVQGDAESARFRKAVILTGSAAGATAGQLQDMARAVAAITGQTQGNAADVVAQLAESGKVAAEVMPQVSAAIVRMSAAGGAAAEDLVDRFAALSDDPVKAVLKLNGAYNFLTPAVYDQIRALEAQGRHEEAVTAAMNASATAASERAEELRDSGGVIERAWNAAASAVRSVADAVKGVGRDRTLSEQIRDVETKIADIEGNAYYRANPFRDVDAELAQLRQRLSMLRVQASAERAWGEAARERNQQLAAYRDLEKYILPLQEKGAKQTQSLAQALGEYRSKLEEVRRLNPGDSMLDPAAIKAGEVQIRKNFASQGQAAQQAAKDYQALRNQLAGLQPDYQANLAMLAQLGVGTDAYREAVEALIARQPFARDLAREQADADKKAAQAKEEAAAAIQGYLSKIEDQARAAEDDVAAYGKTRSAIEATTVARLEEQRVIALLGDDSQAVAILEREIAARRRLVEALASKEALEAQREAAKQTADFWGKVYDDVGEKITAAVFKGGKSGWELIKQAIESTAIRAYIQPVITSGVAALGQAIGLGPGAAGGAGLLGNLGGAASLASLAGPTFAGQLGLGFTGASTSSLFAAGGAAAGAGQYGAALGSYAGAIAPYALAAYAGYQLLKSVGAFEGASPHRGGAAYSTIGGASGAAFAPNAPGFGLEWGAYRATGGGDRSAALDDAVATVIDTVAGSIAARAERYGASADGLRVVGKFAADGKDPSQGGYAVYGSGGSVLYGNTGKYSKDQQEAFSAFGSDALRAEVAALQGLDLPGWVRDLLGSVDPLTSSLEQLTGVLDTADQIAGAVAALAPTLGTSGEEFAALAQSLGGIDAATGALAGYYDAIYSGADKLANAQAALADQFDALGLAVPESGEEFKALADGIDRSTDSGRALYAALVKVAPAFAQVSAAAAQAAAGFYTDDFFTADELRARASADLAEQFGALGVALPATREAFRGLVEGADTSTDAGRALYNALIALAPAFAKVTDAAVDASAAAEGNAQAAARSVHKYGDVFHTMEEYQIQWAQIQAENARVNAQVMDVARGQIADLRKFHDQILGQFSQLSPEEAYQQARASFDSTVAGPHTVEALQSAASALLEASKAYFAGTAGFFADRGDVLMAIQELAGYYGSNYGVAVPQFAGGGDHLGGLRIVGERGPELEATGPARYYSADATRALLSSNDNAPLLRELRAVVAVLQDGLGQLIERADRQDGRLAGLERAARLDSARPRAIA